MREGAVLSSPIAFDDSNWGNAALSVADIDGDGRLDLMVNAPDRTAVFLGDPQGTFTNAPNHVLAKTPPARAALWGDMDNDGLIDLTLCGDTGVQLWRQAPAGDWRQTQQGAALPCTDGALFDADHDGDLDIFYTGAEGQRTPQQQPGRHLPSPR